ncbi:MAG: hypothetical protein ACRC1T_09565 [Clostridium chrysemydis]|uniref:hypothetical protein n=1 Tax=Clostridium chrysemydis TaxID=2665504 RepID=UPI003F31A91E
MTVKDLIDKLQKIDNKELEVKLLSIGEKESVDLVGNLGEDIILGSNDLIDSNIVFVE